MCIFSRKNDIKIKYLKYIGQKIHVNFLLDLVIVNVKYYLVFFYLMFSTIYKIKQKLSKNFFFLMQGVLKRFNLTKIQKRKFSIKPIPSHL